MLNKLPTLTGDLRSRVLLLLLIGVAAFWMFPVYAADAAQDMEWGVMGMKLFGGLALFLFGMEQMADALKAVAGEQIGRASCRERV